MSEGRTEGNGEVNIPPLSSWDIFEGSLSLENKGSVARDHMANERTFLAWLRTSLSFITIGIGITQLFKLQGKSKVNVGQRVINLDIQDSDQFTAYGKPLGSLFIILGIVTLLYGFVRFFQVQHLLTHNYYPAARKPLAGLVGAIFVIIFATLVVVVKTY